MSACALAISFLPFWARAVAFAAIGTSGQVYPVAACGQHARRMGAHTIEFNLEPSAASRDVAEARLGKASEIVPSWGGEGLRARV